MPLKTRRLNFRPTPLLGCRGCSRGRECGQVAPGVVSVRGVELLGPGVLCLRASCPLVRPVPGGRGRCGFERADLCCDRFRYGRGRVCMLGWSFCRGVSLLSGIRGVLDWGLVVLLRGRRGAGLYRRESFSFVGLGFQSEHHLIIVKVLQQSEHYHRYFTKV